MKITGEMHFAKALGELKSRGVDLRDVTAGELYELCAACRRCASPFSDVDAELAERPIEVCKGVWFWPLTAGAQVWLQEFAARWWGRGSKRWQWATVYALRHAREREAFTALTDRWRAEAAILRCALTLPLHGDELTAAIERAYGIDPHALRLRDRARPSNEGAQKDFASLVARLEVQSGIPRETWLWERSLGYLLKAYGDLHAFAAAYAPDRRARERMRDELDEAMTDLAQMRAAIFRRVSESAKREEQEHAADGDGDDADAENQVADGEAADGGVVLDEQPAGHAHEEGVVGAGVSVCGEVVHDGADCITNGGRNQ